VNKIKWPSIDSLELITGEGKESARRMLKACKQSVAQAGKMEPLGINAMVDFLDNYPIKSALCFDITQHECGDLAEVICSHFSVPSQAKCSCSEGAGKTVKVKYECPRCGGVVGKPLELEARVREVEEALKELMNVWENKDKAPGWVKRFDNAWEKAKQALQGKEI
jgi:hypothetical protein